MDDVMNDSQMSNDPNMNKQMNGQMMNNNMMANQMYGQQMNNGMMNNQMYGQPMNGQMMNNQMYAQPMNGQMMNGQMMNGQMYAQPMNNNMMNNQMNGQQMNNGMMANQMYGQPMNNGMMNNQMYGQPMNGQMMNNQMYAQPMNNNMMNNQMYGQQMNNGMMTNQIVPANNTETMLQPSEYNIEDDLAKMEKEMVDSEEVLAKAAVFDDYDSNRDFNNMIISFGKEAAEELGKASDGVLANKTRADLMGEQSLGLMKTLHRIFDDLSPAALKEPTGIRKMFGDMKKKLERYIAKYQSVTGDIDKIYAELKKYEEDAKAANRDLIKLFDANVNTFHEMKKYIFAGAIGVKKLDEQISKVDMQYQQTRNNALTFKLKELSDARELLDQRVQDLRIAENVALQSIPQLKTMEMNNNVIIREINTNFIITLPIFKQGIAQAILLKQQTQQTEALTELRKKTNEMLIRNAQNTVQAAKNAATLSSSSPISVETLEETWKTITNGIDQVSKIQEDARKKRVEDASKLESIKQDFYNKFGQPSKAN